MLTTQPNEAVLVATIDIAILACTAGPIIYDWLYGDPRAYLDVVYVVANLLYHTAEFVAQGQWHFLVGDRVRGGWYNACTSEIFVEVYTVSINDTFCRGSFRTGPAYSDIGWVHLS